MHPIEHRTNPTSTHEPKPTWVLSVRDLCQETSPARYRFVALDGQIKSAVLSKRKRQVVDTLLKSELYCASTVRIGDVVFRLKQDEGIYADTLTDHNGRKYYSLNCKVEFIGPAASSEVAA